MRARIFFALLAFLTLFIVFLGWVDQGHIVAPQDNPLPPIIPTTTYRPV